jgi:gamma-glutamyltranspeptidase
MLATAAVALLLQAGPLSNGYTARDPAYAPDGRLAVSIDGDLWLRRRDGGWTRLTSGPAWDREPAWTPDGRAVVFTSDRSGNGDLYRLGVGPGGPSGAAERMTTSEDPDGEAAVARDGSLIFVRGRDARARLFQRTPTGEEKRVTRGETPERWPTFSPDGGRVAYVELGDRAQRLRVRRLDTGADSVVLSDRAPERASWSPDGDRLAFFSDSPRAGVYVAPVDGRYVNLLSTRRGTPAWAPDGRAILLADRVSDDAGYNGDPDRVGDRSIAERLTAGEGLYSVEAPPPPDAGGRAVVVSPAVERSARNGEAFDRFWARMNDVYYSAPDASERRARWAALRDAYRPRAVSAKTDVELERVLHQLLRERPPLRTEATGRAAVSSAHPVASAAGTEILAKGGNVVDAAVAVSFALGVVEPDASGVGGYGEMLIQLEGMREPALIEFMARVPEEAALSNAALLQDGRYPSDGPVLAMVPGTVAGMHRAWTRFGSGKVPWADLLAPAIRAARDGYVVSDGLATTLELERDRFLKYEGSKALFFRDGRPLRAGDTLRNADLAWTLEQIAKGGADGFYKGEVARRLVNDLRGKGNAIRQTDLARYFAADRDPVQASYRGLTIFSSAPPAIGGAILSAQLNNLEQVTQPRLHTDDAATLHAMIAAWQLIPSARGRVADPSLWPVNLDPFTSKDTARARWKCFDPGHAVTPAMFRGDTLACAGAASASSGSGGGDLREGDGDGATCFGVDHAAGAVCRPSGTTAFVVADAAGNAVSVTQTLGTWGGNFYVTPGLGFLYNDKLTSYGTDPGSYGARLPYARHGSTISPTLVMRGEGEDRRPVLALGAAGNAWINAAVYQTLVGVLDFGLTPQQALELPRFLPSQRGGAGGARRELVIELEDGYAPDVVARLRAMGYRFDVISLKGELRMGYGAAIAIGPDAVRAGADPRRSGAAAAVR